MNITQQKSSEKIWKNEAGESVPYNRTTTYERAAERVTAILARKAVAINQVLSDFKQTIQFEAGELYEAFLKENNGVAGKGNKVFYNFDRSVKIEVSVNETISFDENTIGLAKSKLDEFLTKNTHGIDAVIKELVLSAFETSKGRLDAKKVLSLKRHESRINDKLFSEAVGLIDKAIRRTDSKTYFRVWIKDDNGAYQNIDLNFSSIS